MNRDLLNYILIGVGIAALLAVYFLFAFLPLDKKLQTRRAAFALAQKKLATAQDLAAHFDELLARRQALERERQDLEERMPGEPEIPGLLKEVARTAAECNLKDFQFIPQPAVDMGGYRLQPVRVTVTSDYHSLGQFVSRLAGLKRLIITRDFNLVGLDKTGNTSSVSAIMTLVTYVQNEP